MDGLSRPEVQKIEHDPRERLTSAFTHLKAADSLLPSLPKTETEKGYPVALGSYREQLLAGALCLARHFNTANPLVVFDSDRLDEGNYSFTDFDPDNSLGYHPHEVVVFDFFGPTPFAVRTNERESDGAISFQIAFMRQGQTTGAKLFTHGKLTEAGELSLFEEEVAVLEFYRESREEERLFLRETGIGEVEVISGNRFEYTGQPRTFTTPIPPRELRRIFHDVKVELTTGPEDEPGSRQISIADDELRNMGLLDEKKLIEFFSRENRIPRTQDFRLADILAYSQAKA